MFDWRNRAEWWQLIRYYQAGVVNIAFGYSLFAVLVFAGLQVYAAQLVGHVLGVAFNYFTYSRYAFADRQGDKFSFFMSYVGNYLLGLAGLWAALKVIASPYIAGFLVTLAVSVVNYLVLKLFVFHRFSKGEGASS